MNLKSFGCSFIFGTDLPDTLPEYQNTWTQSSPRHLPPWISGSHMSWPALVSRELGWQYRCFARGGIGNDLIHHTVCYHAALYTGDDFFVIGWTFPDRFDFVDSASNNEPKWQTLRPDLSHQHADYYYKNLHSDYRDKFTTLNYMFSTISLLTKLNIPFLMTSMDDLIFDTTYHQTPTSQLLQQQITPYLDWFEDKNFLTWARDNKYPISNTLHPLQDAHVRAAEIMLPVIKTKII